MNYILGNLSLILLALSSSFFFLFLSLGKGLEILFKLKLTIFIISSFALSILAIAYINSDFSLLNIYLNSYSEKPLFYKIAAIWGNHEGSLLLFIFLLAAVNLLTLNKVTNKKVIALCQQTIMLIVALFSLYLFFTSNPFLLNKELTNNGLGLNPILQDFALIIHPPILYLGYIISIITYAFTIALVKENKFTFANLKTILSLNKLAFVTLTLGIMLGSWWAYRELGWGGYWFWDPVENLALLIWLFSLLSLHSNIAILQNKNLLNWFVFSALTTFLIILLSFFVIRSGILISVHSFADDPYRGVFLLLIFLIVTCYTIYALRNFKHKRREVKFSLNKSNLIRIQNFLITSVIIIVSFGVFFPIFYNVIVKQELFIGPDFFNKSILPILLIILAFMSVVPYRNIRFNLLIKLVVLALASLLIILIIQAKYDWLIALFALIVIVSNINASLQFKGKFRLSKSNIAHASFALIILAISLNNLNKLETEQVITKDKPLEFLDYSLNFNGFTEGRASNYLYAKASFQLKHKNKIIELSPEQRYYLASDITTKEVYIKRYALHDIYLVIGEIYSKNKVKIRFIYNPYINLLWLAALLLILQFFLRVKNDKKNKF